ESDPTRQDKPARLEVHVGEVHVVLEGDPSFVLRAYKEVQAQVSTAIQVSAPKPAPERQQRHIPRAVPHAGRSEARKHGRDRGVLWVSRCDHALRKVYAAERGDFAASPFAQRYGLSEVNHIYVEDDRILRALKHDAETLWFEVDRFDD